MATLSGKPSSSTALNYQSSVQVGPSNNPARLKGMIFAPSHTPPGTRTTRTAATQFANMNKFNDWGQMSNAATAANSQNIMATQKLRSEATLGGIQNLTRIYSDFNDRSKAQTQLGGEIGASDAALAYGTQAAAIRRLANILRNNP